ncbi:uncharacterized protein [Clytia hemisphaerica]|uniref:uncharacterized protein n=1 Tax=Clytia hemisphaerica TaxID=252671 RepID=UPI0034D61DC9
MLLTWLPIASFMLVGINATCLNNYQYQFTSEWKKGQGYRTNAIIKTNFNYPLKDWTLEIEFDQPLLQPLTSWVTKGDKGRRGQSTVKLTPEHYNKILNQWNTRFEMSYFVDFKNRQGRNHIVCAQFCGTRTDTGEKICDTAHVTTRKPTTPAATQTTRATTQKTTRATTQKTTRATTQKTTRATTQKTTRATTQKTTRGKTQKTTRATTQTTTRATTQKTTRATTQKTTRAATQKTTRATTQKTTRATTQKTTRATTQKTTRQPTLKTTKRYTTKHTTRHPTTNNPTTKRFTITSTPTARTSKNTPTTTTTTPTTTTTTPNATTTTPTATTTTPTTKTTTTQCKPKYNYPEVLEKSLLFYEAQRSGKLPANQRVEWRHDSTMTDGSDVSLDLTGGYFDGGDYVKFGFPMAATITNLAWGMLEFKKGYTSSGQYEYGLKAIKWGTDYFIKCHPSAHRLFGQVGDGDVDHSAWGRPEDMKLLRPAYDIDENRPGSDLAGETAAALAASSLVFKEVDADYSDVLLQHAKELYSFAMDFRGLYHESIPDATEFYKSHNGYKDELAWASLWLFRATGDATYKNNFLKEFDNDAYSQSPGEFSWDNKWHGVQVLAQQLNVSDKDYLGNLKSALEQPKKTAKGLFYVKRWGPLRHAANLAFLARVASTIVDDKFYNEFARSQINYILGDAGRSYVVGFGTNPPQQPHHRSSSCPVNGPCSWDNLFSSSPNPQILYGALVGGPDANDRYTDKRADYIKNEVTVDYNAGFQSAIAGLIQLAEEENDC